jgi:Holliday junction resolvasome RuvABC ATP-dependent DNA helicase subunit
MSMIAPELSSKQNYTSDIAIEDISDLQSLLDDLRDDEIFIASDKHTGSQS